MNAGLSPQFKTYAKAFEQSHQGWTITVEDSPATTPDYIQQLTTKALAGKAPDILFNADVLNQTFAKNNLLLDLKPALEKGEGSLSLHNFLPNFLGQYNVEGKITGIPVSADSGLLYYNEDLFAKYGVALPTESWTYQDMLDAAQKITKASGGKVYGIATPLGAGSSFFQIYPVIKAWGGDIYDAKTKKFVFANDNSLKAWTQLYEPYQKGYGTRFEPKSGTPWFQSQQAAMTIDSTPAVGVYRDGLKDVKWNVMRSPEQNGNSTTGGGSYALSVSAKAPNQAGALEFLSWFYDKDGGMKVAAANAVIPATKDGVTKGNWKSEAKATPAGFVAAAEYAVTNAVMIPPIPDQVAPEVDPALREAAERVLLQGVPIAQAYKDAQDKLNGLLG